MKALSVRNPWATLIAQRKKTIEVRSWATKYRGPLLICATKNPPGPNAGNAVCVVDLVEVIDSGTCYYWILDNIRTIKPFPVRGQQGLFNVKL